MANKSSSKSLCLLLLLTTVLFWLFNVSDGQHLSSHHHQHHHSGGYRRQMNVMRSMAQKAYEHGIRINEEAQCSKPKPQLIYLNDSKKIYLPRATLLHKCSDMFGCCPHATHSCEPSRVEKVQLYFFVIGVQSPGAVMRRNQNIEQLTFINHTECTCQPIDPMWSPIQSDGPMTMNMNNINKHDNMTAQQVRTIRDEGFRTPGNPHMIHPSYVFHGRNHEIPSTMQDFYKENENVLKYWAKVFGYNSDSYYKYKNNPKRQNKRNITKKLTTNTYQLYGFGQHSNYQSQLPPPPSSSSPSSNSRVLFSTPDITYSYSTIHEKQNNGGHMEQIKLLDSSSSVANDIGYENNHIIQPQQQQQHHIIDVSPTILTTISGSSSSPPLSPSTSQSSTLHDYGNYHHKIVLAADQQQQLIQEEPQQQQHLLITYPLITVPFQ